MVMHMPKTIIRSNAKGFTLIEMLVAIFVFVVVVVAVLDLFMIAQRAQRTAASLENLQDDMRFSLNRIADEVRDVSIDYAEYAKSGIPIDPIAGNDELIIHTFDGASMHFKVGKADGGECLNSGDTATLETQRCLLIKENANAPAGDPASQWHSMTANGVSVDELKFYITPTTDPFEYNETAKQYDSNLQPRVRIVLTGSSKIQQSDTRVSIPLQTLISTREYRR